MRNLLVFILVALFACGGQKLGGCKKKVEPAETAETAEVVPATVEEPVETAEVPAETGVEEAPAEEGEPGEGGE